MAIQIKYRPDGSTPRIIKTLNSEDFSIIPDDRLEMVQLIDGVHITDGGRYEAGDKYLVTVMVDNATWQTIKKLWNRRDTVDVRFEDNTTVEDCIILVKSIVYADKLHPLYKKLQLEFWKGESE